MPTAPPRPPRPPPATPARLAIYNFTSRWFLVPQGTGITAVILHQLDYQFRGLQIISYVFWVTTIVLLLGMVFVYATRCIIFPQKVATMLGQDMDELACINSITISYTSVIQMMAVTLVQGWGKGWGIAVYVLWWINVAMAVLGTVIIPFVFMRIYPKRSQRLSPTSRLPLIAALTAAAGGGTICQYAELASNLQVPVIVVSYLLVGAALPLAFALDAFVWHRLFDGSVPDQQITFQEMITCGPWGQGSFALQGLGAAVLHGSFANYGSGIFLTAKAAEPVGYASIFAGLLAWGMGTFWWAFAILSIAHTAIDNWRWRGIPFSLATWSVVFPWVRYFHL
jgi:tellurite resistance protein TehA-like permease